MIGRHVLKSASLTLLAAALAAPAFAQANYSRAEQLLSWNTDKLVSGDQVNPQWLKDGNRFWYRNKTADGAEFVLIDPVANGRRLLFDHMRLAVAMSTAGDTAFDGKRLPFNTFKFTNDGDNENEIEFNTGKRRFVCNITSYRCTVGDTAKSDQPYVVSPDKKLEAFVHNYNLYVRTRGGSDSTQLTTDGVQWFSYGLAERRPFETFRPQGARRPLVRWSPDSKKLVVYRVDERGVGHMHYLSMTSQRVRHFSQPYALPGDTLVPYPHIYVIDVASKQSVEAKIAPRPAQLGTGGSAVDSAWSETSDKVHIAFQTRGSKSAYLGEVNAATGDFRVIARDTGKTYTEISNPQDPSSWYVTKDGKDAFWWSERDGWGHLYRFDATGVTSITSTDGDGSISMAPEPKAQLTNGAWQVGRISYVDETAKQIYFTGRGREGFLYYPKLYRMGYDGSNVTVVTPEDGYHQISFSPSGKYFVDTYSKIETPPVSVLRSTATGAVVRKLEEADISRLKAIGWRPGQVFSVKARDGITDIYGVLYLPPNIDSTKKYPIITHIYPGPQVGSVGQWNFKNGGEQFSLAELGFVVIQLDHLGTPLRSKAFHDNYYGFFGDNGLPDHITAIKQLASRYSFIDADRVGIFGHSGGGFASTDAILRYPEFFKVAVSGAGNHDNRSYNIGWAEKYQGLMVRDTVKKTDNFETSANKTMAKNLRGKLLLMHGDMDDNVHPANTIQVVDELIKANKTFDLIIAPNRSHGLNEPYFIRRRWDYFVQHLLGQTPPENYLIIEPTNNPRAAVQTPDDEDQPAVLRIWPIMPINP
ncbi:MAG TPA: DPP IV N-terminal domain-containing protein [Gemmatimonadaceae bacterium]|jgi:dipeptidyl aminopeptidase/acylaminoacyl peptidase|nr:DPP IV N-terminal domain-containing protein [Gemmatimonadaceae bacterium]